MITKDLDKDVESYQSKGFSVFVDGSFGDVRFAYMDTRPAIGCLTELVQDGDSIRRMCAVGANAAAGWNGDRPVRLLADYL